MVSLPSPSFPSASQAGQAAASELTACPTEPTEDSSACCTDGDNVEDNSFYDNFSTSTSGSGGTEADGKDTVECGADLVSVVLWLHGSSSMDGQACAGQQAI